MNTPPRLPNNVERRLSFLMRSSSSWLLLLLLLLPPVVTTVKGVFTTNTSTVSLRESL